MRGLASDGGTGGEKCEEPEMAEHGVRVRHFRGSENGEIAVDEIKIRGRVGPCR